MKRINALTIAGTDPSGGAGIQADLKTFSALGAYGCSVITALVAQNTRGVQSVYRIEPDFVAAQLIRCSATCALIPPKSACWPKRTLLKRWQND
jgi:hydroxymethylpyrimidine kinase/phosphomethylpyrimidine kinase